MVEAEAAPAAFVEAVRLLGRCEAAAVSPEGVGGENLHRFVAFVEHLRGLLRRLEDAGEARWAGEVGARIEALEEATDEARLRLRSRKQAPPVAAAQAAGGGGGVLRESARHSAVARTKRELLAGASRAAAAAATEVSPQEELLGTRRRRRAAAKTERRAAQRGRDPAAAADVAQHAKQLEELDEMVGALRESALGLRDELKRDAAVLDKLDESTGENQAQLGGLVYRVNEHISSSRGTTSWSCCVLVAVGVIFWAMFVFMKLFRKPLA